MRPILLDSSIYIAALRAGRDATLALQRLAPDAPVWLSAVVLEELYAGVSLEDRRVVERLERDFDRAGRILVPNLNDWAQAGKVLARLAAEHGYEQIGRSRLTNDALIAMSAARQGITVITANQRDFARLAQFRPFQWEARAI
jgi:predicted nucleic acid-binding protein